MLRIEFLPAKWGKEKWVMLGDSRIFFRQWQWRSVAEFARNSAHASCPNLTGSKQKEATALICSYLVCACSSRGRPLNAIPTILAELKARKKRQVLDENCSSDDKTWENLALLPRTTFPTNWWPWQASPLWTATPWLDVTSMRPLAHPLERLHLELRGRAKDVKFAVKKKNQRILMLTWGSHTSQPLARKGSRHRLWYTLFWACPWIDLEGAPSKLRRAKYAVKHLSTLANGLNVGLGTASPHSK